MATTISRRLLHAGAIAAMAVLAAACGDDVKSGNQTVTAVDYKFNGLPSAVEPGTTLTLQNDSARELHELVVIRLKDDEKRSVKELVALPEAEAEQAFAGEPAMVLIAPPGGAPVIKAVGDGTLTEKGRYAVICAIPTGADPAAYLAAAQSSQGGPPNVPGGPPHLAQGMYGEIKVK